MKINWKVLVVCFVIIFLVAFLGSLFTTKETKSLWYEENKPSITPPNWVFPIAWTILFILIALSLYFAWIKSNKKQRISVAIAYGINFILNILWSFLFFKLKFTVFAFIEIIVLWLSILLMIIVSYGIDRKAGRLLVPYFLWVSFASVLNFFFAFA